MFSFMFKKEPTDAQIATCFVLARKVFIRLYEHNPKQADELAFKQVSEWIENDKVDIALRQFWKQKIA